MIGHYLLTLTEAQEDRVLTIKLRGGWYVNREYGECRCLRGAAENYDGSGLNGFADERRFRQHWRSQTSCGDRYDELFGRFGERVNVAIRNRILSNRARRVLQNRPVQLETVTP